VGAINIRFPPQFLQGAFSNPDPDLRAAAVQLAADGCKTAATLGAAHVIVWSPYDGYDFHMQVGSLMGNHMVKGTSRTGSGMRGTGLRVPYVACAACC